jgi:hypothetical protein
MNRRAIAASLLTAIAAVSIGVDGAERARGHSLGAPLQPIGKLLQPVWSEVSPDARIFLVAGGRDSANFAQEIVDQKKFWLARGYTAKQIECFYAVPPSAQEDDADQFLSLEEGLRSCHLAAPDIIFSAIEKVAQNPGQEFFYLYVSSHGTDPLLTQKLPRGMLRDPDMAWFVEARAQASASPESEAFKWFSPYRMEVEGVGDASDWGWLSFSSRYLKNQKTRGTPVEGQLFTPAYLAKALEKFPEQTRKIVVLQACHSGGFVLPADQAPSPEQTLVNVKNITVLTAARADRTSFGCDTADHTTYYGGALQEAFNGSAGKIPALDWQRIHDEVPAKVEKLEGDKKIPDEQRSLPQYYSNTAAGKQK